MRKSWLVVSLIVLVVVVAGMVGCGTPAPTQAPAPAPAPAPEKVYKFKFSWNMPPGLGDAVFIPYAQAIEQESKGRIQFDRYPMGQLLPENGTVDGIANGIADCGQACPGAYFPGRFPMGELVFLPFTWIGGVDGAKIRRKFAQYEPVKAEYTKAGLLCLDPGCTGPYHLISSRPIKSFEDMKGLKVRSWGTILAKILEFCGAVPVSMPGAEVYTALQTGILHGNPASFDAMYDMKQFEVVKNISVFPKGGFTLANTDIVWGLKSWNNLPKDIQDIVLRVTERKYWLSEGWAGITDKAKPKLEAAGVIFHYLSGSEGAKFEEQANKLGEWWIEQNKNNGPSRDVYNYYYSLLKEAGLR